jgi:dienelactone hydrolase
MMLNKSILSFLWAATFTVTAVAQPYGRPDRDSPGDEMIQAYLRKEAEKVAARFVDDVFSKNAWEAKRPQYLEEYFYMLGLSPIPEKTPLRAAVTRTLRRDDYVVEMLHYQSRPGLYVTGNLYRPASVKDGERLPAVLYVCGHSNRGRDGNKVAYQSHGIWFARHGYVCLVVDTLQLGEIAATHHGTYNLQRWWWHSRGYTPAGVEAWNGIRGIDYLIGRADVDPGRLAVTGISGGGAATWKRSLLARVRQASFRYFPETIPPATKLGDVDALSERVQSEEGIEFRLRFTAPPPGDGAKSVLMVVLNQDEAGTTPDWVKKVATADRAVALCEPRGIGATRWTRKNPPNYVERSHVLLGRTVDAGRVWDVIAAARAVAASRDSQAIARRRRLRFTSPAARGPP